MLGVGSSDSPEVRSSDVVVGFPMNGRKEAMVQYETGLLVESVKTWSELEEHSERLQVHAQLEELQSQ